jgi:hypothetical protein
MSDHVPLLSHFPVAIANVTLAIARVIYFVVAL